MFSFGSAAQPQSTMLALPPATTQPTTQPEIVQFSTLFSKLPQTMQNKFQEIDAQFQKHAMDSSEIDRLLEDADRSEHFAVSDIAKFEQRLRFLQLQIRKTKTGLQGFRDQVRKDLKHGEQALFANARLKHKSIQQLWPQLPSPYFWEKVEEFKDCISKLSQDVEDIQHHLSTATAQQSPPQVLHSLFVANHSEREKLSSDIARVHSAINLQKEIFIDAKVSTKENPFQMSTTTKDRPLLLTQG